MIHSSTTKHIAAVYKKPLIFLTSDEINKSWFRTHIKENRKLFDAKMVNIDNFNSKIDNLKIDKNRYKIFLNNYVIHPKFKSKKYNFLKIIKDILNDE